MTFKLLMAAAAVVAVPVLQGIWKADAANAKITFTIKGPFGKVNGSFSGLQAEIKFDEKNPAGGSISASVDAKSVSTGVGLRNKDLRNKEEWFNTDKYPRISFRSTKIEKTGSGYKAVGELTLKGVTKPESIAFTFAGDVFKGTLLIQREDFNLGKHGGSVGNDVTIQLEVPVKRAS